jgi:hypothetical protein
MAEASFVKDPSAVLDYIIDWTDWLDDDTISTSSWTIPSGLTAAYADTNNTTTATVWLSGGTAGTNYSVINHITTAANREDDRTLKIKVRQK